MNSDLIQLSYKLLSNKELDTLNSIFMDEQEIYKGILSLDKMMGGIGIYNINEKNKGRYHINDRNVFRPLQYIDAHFKLDYENAVWVTREIIHMCGLHLESMIKNLFNFNRMT